MIAVGVTENPQADLLDPLHLATPLLLHLVTPLSHQAELKDPASKLPPPRLLIADSDPLVLEHLLHRPTERAPFRLGEILDPAQAGFIAVLFLEEIELIGQRHHLVSPLLRH